MAIRVRRVNGKLIALCAAKTKPRKDDMYLDDNVHHALTAKFESDFKKMGMLKEG